LNALFNLSKLSVWWLRLGIGIERIKPGHPQQNGRHERMHLTLKKEATRPPGMNSLQQHDRDVVVTACGRICMHRKRINVSTVLAGQRVGIKEVDESIWIVSFMQYDLGFFDHETGRLESVDNPFAAKVSPMSPV
jgi:transposase InsO family protein